MKPTLAPRWALVAITAFAIVALVLAAVISGNSIWRDIFVNLGAGLAATVVTVLLIDRALGKREEDRARRFVDRARARLKGPLHRQISLWINIYKASVPSKPLNPPERFSDFAKAEHLQHIALFTAVGTAPYAPAKPWPICLHDELDRFRQELEDVLDKFGVFMQPEFMEMISNCSESGLIKQVLVLPQLSGTLRGQPIFVARDVDDAFIPKLLPWLVPYLEAVGKLISEISASEGAIAIPQTTWTDGGYPAYGSARFQPGTISANTNAV